MNANQRNDDPIQNRVLSDACWNGYHHKADFRDGAGTMQVGCPGWHGTCKVCTKNKCSGINACVCSCHSRCECMCHDPQVKTPRKKFDKHATMDILETGCGEIKIG